MIDKILLPLPSEYFPKNAVKRAIQLASKFKSQLILEYIYEERVIDKVDNVSSGAVTSQSLQKMADEVKYVEVGSESSVIFEEVENLAENKKIKIKKIIQSGIHSDEILDCIKEQDIDLMITEFHKETLSKYRFLYESPVPVWIEHDGKNIEKINGILTNISMNKLVPMFSFNLLKKFKVPLHFYYVLDKTDPYNEKVEKDQREELFAKIERISKNIGFNYELSVVTKEISTFINHQFKNEDSSLVVLGRFTKPVKFLFSNFDKKIEVSKKLGTNVLMLRGDLKIKPRMVQ